MKDAGWSGGRPERGRNQEDRQRDEEVGPVLRGLHETLIDVDEAEGEESHGAADSDCKEERSVSQEIRFF